MELLKRRVVEEDMVQYSLFLVQPTHSDPLDRDRRLKELVEDILAKMAALLMPYIWQSQPFVLKYQPEKGEVPAHIGGFTQFGDNVEDEWFIVYLLRQITEAFPELAARVEDNDGEFLLIEAADFLPKWLNPETSENRVFLHKGELYILPCPSRSSDLGVPRDTVPSVAQAMDLLSAHPGACLAGPRIRSALAQRLEGYPEKIQANLHRAHCFLPAGIATVLSQRPALVAPAVLAFYLRDPLDLQACRSFKTFHPDTRVLTSVTFTRCLYAQLQQQQFTPDRRSGYTLPLRSQPQYQAHELGMKLAHGFEILVSKCRQTSSEPTALLTSNPQWKHFLDSLKKNGYFKGELEGSAHYRELLISAETFFRQIASPTHSSSRDSSGEEILRLLQTSPSFDVEELRRQEKLLPPEDTTAQSGERQQETEKEEGQEEEEGGYSLVAVTQGMKNFINTMSSHEGAELPWCQSNEPFTFDADSMAGALDRLLGVKDEELDSDDLEEEEEEEEEDEEEEDDDEDDGEEEEGRSVWQGGEDGPDALNNLRSYMEEMDQELMGTHVGKSFTPKQDSDKTGLANNCPRTQGGEGLRGPGEEEEEEEEIQPLDVDLNLVTNLLESLSSQAGLAGPASNLLQSLGIHLPPNTDRP
ncbi:protein ecdysoneless homolog [Aplochiton taeniatus]